MRVSPIRLFLVLGSFSLLLLVVFSQGSGGLRQKVRSFLDPALSAGGLVGRPIATAGTWARGILGTQRETRELRLRLASLEATLVERERELLFLRRQMRELAQTADPAQGLRGLVPARVKGLDPSPWARSLWIDRGQMDGLQLGFPVLAGGVLVGRVAEVHEKAARVQLLADPMSAAIVEIQPARKASPVREEELAQGVLKGAGACDRYRLDMVLNPLRVERGDAVVTTGFDAKFPRGLFVGRVESAQQGDLFQRIEVSIPVPLSSLEAVQVVTSGSPGGEAR